jgi:fido (protein-threonine AMPylation protein)
MQREFIRQVAAANGFEIMWSRISSEQMIAASIASFNNDLEPLIHILAESVP